MTTQDLHRPTTSDHDRVHSSGAGRRADVVVVGAGLGGLVAALCAARSGASVVLVDAGSVGGRARVRVVEPGVTFNGGPRALYRRGAAARELARLGVRWSGGAPPARGGRLWRDGRLHTMPGTAPELLSTSALGVGAKVRVGALLGTIGLRRPERLVGTTVREWIDGLGLADDAAGLLHAVVRLATYVDRADELDAGAALAQLQLALGDGVTYLDGGWGGLVDQLVELVRAAGVQLVDHGRVHTIRQVGSGPPGAAHDVGASDRADRPRWRVEVDRGPWWCDAAVLAVGTPAAATALSPVPLATAALGEPVTAACWELALRGPLPVPFVLGVDRPTYLSRHSPPARLAPEGIEVVHLLRYGATDSASDRAELEELAAIAGVKPDRVVAQRFLHRMVVSGGVPSAAGGGVAGRPSVQVPGAQGLFLAGDWVGGEGLLADAAVSSGVLAGLAAAGSAGQGSCERESAGSGCAT